MVRTARRRNNCCHWDSLFLIMLFLDVGNNILIFVCPQRLVFCFGANIFPVERKIIGQRSCLLAWNGKRKKKLFWHWKLIHTISDLCFQLPLPMNDALEVDLTGNLVTLYDRWATSLGHRLLLQVAYRSPCTKAWLRCYRSLVHCDIIYKSALEARKEKLNSQSPC